MPKKLEYTPNSMIKSALRKLFLRSRERAKRLKDDKYTCQICGAKQSRAKGKEVYVEVHHKQNGINNWDKIYAVIREELLCGPENLETLCRECHKKETENGKKGND